MNLLWTLSNLEVIVSMEDEVRKFLKQELKDYADEIMYYNLGSIIFRIGDNKVISSLILKFDKI